MRPDSRPGSAKRVRSLSRRAYFLRGLYVTCGALLCITGVYVADMVIAYDGKCGGFFPGISARHACSLWEYATGDMLAIAMVLAISYWPVMLALLILPSFIGHLFDRRQLHHDN
jgi:hypothetical protein